MKNLKDEYNEIGIASKYFECNCMGYDHPLRITHILPDYPEVTSTWNGEEIYMAVSNKVGWSFWKRLKNVLSYIFKRGPYNDGLYCHEFILTDRKRVDEIIGYLDRFGKIK